MKLTQVSTNLYYNLNSFFSGWCYHVVLISSLKRSNSVFNIFLKRKIRFTLFFIFYVGINLNAQQTPILLKSTLNTIGSSPSFSSNTTDQKFIFRQSIAQSGITGTVQTKKLKVQQGFVTHAWVYRIDNSENESFDEVFNISVYPNPFADRIHIEFSKKTREVIHVHLFDVNGKQVLSKEYEASDQITLPLPYISEGNYVLHIRSGHKKTSKKIIKHD